MCLSIDVALSDFPDCSASIWPDVCRISVDEWKKKIRSNDGTRRELLHQRINATDKGISLLSKIIAPHVTSNAFLPVSSTALLSLLSTQTTFIAASIVYHLAE